MSHKNKNGKVFLVGAGPGDPGLITVKGMECIRQADVLIYDYLASPALLKYASENAKSIYVGKKGGDHTLSQNGINQLLVEKAEKGFVVTRLKGGDPFIFGRGGEEVEVLIKAQIPFEIVPGVTSAVAAPAYAGIPLTHRKYASAVTFVTGHEDPDKEKSDIDWESLVRGGGTIVFLMGVKNLPLIARQLMNCGMPPDKSVALVRWGTTPKQMTVTGRLDTIVNHVKKAGLKPPAVIIVGDVVNLRAEMKWFENRPLMGKKILVTRSREQASNMVKALSDLGAECLDCPVIKIVQPDDTAPLNTAIENLSSYDWLIFTSVNGVKFFFDRLYASGRDIRSLSNLNTASIGPATAEKLFCFGLKSDILPESYRAESIIESFAKEDIEGKRILIPRAKEARPILPVELRKMGAVVDEITAYHTKDVKENADLVLKELEKETIDLITFTSSSTVKNFKAILPSEKSESLMKNVIIASIGPITTQTARKLGFHVHVTAETFTIPGLCDAILRYYKSQM